MSDQPKPTDEPIPCKAGQGFIHWKQRHADKCLICHPQSKPTGSDFMQAAKVITDGMPAQPKPATVCNVRRRQAWECTCMADAYCKVHGNQSSHQPKPTTGEQEFGEQIFCWKCGRPYHTADRECPNCGGLNLTPDLCAKPTDEWTEGMVFAYWESEDWQGLADAHNVALAAERKRCDPNEFEKQAQVAVAYYEQQLAAEREKVENLHKILGQKRTTIKELREQLFDERERHKQHVEGTNRLITKLNDTVAQLRKQLATVEQSYNEREKVQTYEGALIKIANDPNCDRCQVAVDALAKIGRK